MPPRKRDPRTDPDGPPAPEMDVGVSSSGSDLRKDARILDVLLTNARAELGAMQEKVTHAEKNAHRMQQVAVAADTRAEAADTRAEAADTRANVAEARAVELAQRCTDLARALDIQRELVNVLVSDNEALHTSARKWSGALEELGSAARALSDEIVETTKG